MKRTPLVVAAVAASLAATAGSALAAPSTQRLSPGPATDATISQDGRTARWAAYTAAGNVLVVRRAQPFTTTGSPWNAGPTRLASATRAGAPGNGASWGPAFDGSDYKHGGREIIVAPRCLAFVSAASDLVAGDRDGRADVFVRRLSTGGLTRIAGRGAVSEVALDGTCRRLAFVAGGTVYTANASGRGGAHRVSGRGAADSPSLSANGKTVTFARRGAVYVSARGRTRRIASGAHPTSDDFSKAVAFERGGMLARASLVGSPRVRSVAQRGAGLASGSRPSLSAAGSFVFYAQGPLVRLSTFQTPMGNCGTAAAVRPVGSGHGNYVVYTCGGGGAFLTYVGPK